MSLRNSGAWLLTGPRVSMAIGMACMPVTAECTLTFFFLLTPLPSHRACQMWPEDTTEPEYQWGWRPTLRIYHSATGCQAVWAFPIRPTLVDQTGMMVFDSARQIRSLKTWSFADCPTPLLHDSPCVPLVSTIVPHGQ